MIYLAICSDSVSPISFRRGATTGRPAEAYFLQLFVAYIDTIPLEELIESVERARLDAKLRYVVIYGAACSYCLARAERLDGSYQRTFALELKEQLAQTLAAYVASILAGPRRRADAEETVEPPLRQIVEVLQQVMCTHDAEKLAISVLEIYKSSHEGRRSRRWRSSLATFRCSSRPPS